MTPAEMTSARSLMGRLRSRLGSSGSYGESGSSSGKATKPPRGNARSEYSTSGPCHSQTGGQSVGQSKRHKGLQGGRPQRVLHLWRLPGSGSVTNTARQSDSRSNSRNAEPLPDRDEGLLIRHACELIRDGKKN
eukprot:4232405-Pyramimonas_sp.AAC.2